MWARFAPWGVFLVLLLLLTDAQSKPSQSAFIKRKKIFKQLNEVKEQEFQRRMEVFTPHQKRPIGDLAPQQKVTTTTVRPRRPNLRTSGMHGVYYNKMDL